MEIEVVRVAREMINRRRRQSRMRESDDMSNDACVVHSLITLRERVSIKKDRLQHFRVAFREEGRNERELIPSQIDSLDFCQR